MCTMSMVGDHYMDIWRDRPWYPTGPAVPMPTGPLPTIIQSPITRAEFDDLKRQVAEMTALLKRAQKYDEDNGEPHCEADEKMAVLRKVAELVGVDLDQALAPKP